MQILSSEQNNLKKNISSLYLTAKIEIERKDRIIKDLRSELEDLKFRRGTKPTWQQASLDKPAKEMQTEQPDTIQDSHNYNLTNIMDRETTESTNCSGSDIKSTVNEIVEEKKEINIPHER